MTAIAPTPSNETERRAIRTAAIASTVFGLLYLLGIIVSLATNGTPHSTSGPVQVFSSIIALLWNIDLVILFAALRRLAGEKVRLWADLALAFMVMVCVTSCVNWFTRLVVYPRVALAGDAAVLALIDPNGPTSIMFAIEHLGWGLFLAAAMVFAAFLFTGWARRLSLAVGGLSLLHVVGLAIGSPALDLLGYVAWGVVLPALMVLLARRFGGE